MDDTKDKIKNTKDQVVGRAKEEFGDATDNEKLELKGKIQSSTADVKKKIGDMKEKRSEARDGTLNDNEGMDD